MVGLVLVSLSISKNYNIEYIASLLDIDLTDLEEKLQILIGENKKSHIITSFDHSLVILFNTNINGQEREVSILISKYVPEKLIDVQANSDIESIQYNQEELDFIKNKFGLNHGYYKYIDESQYPFYNTDRFLSYEGDNIWEVHLDRHKGGLYYFFNKDTDEWTSTNRRPAFIPSGWKYTNSREAKIMSVYQVDTKLIGFKYY